MQHPFSINTRLVKNKKLHDASGIVPEMVDITHNLSVFTHICVIDDGAVNMSYLKSPVYILEV